jgi:hypothetical protein
VGVSVSTLLLFFLYYIYIVLSIYPFWWRGCEYTNGQISTSCILIPIQCLLCFAKCLDVLWIKCSEDS